MTNNKLKAGIEFTPIEKCSVVGNCIIVTMPGFEAEESRLLEDKLKNKVMKQIIENGN